MSLEVHPQHHHCPLSHYQLLSQQSCVRQTRFKHIHKFNNSQYEGVMLGWSEL